MIIIIYITITRTKPSLTAQDTVIEHDVELSEESLYTNTIPPHINRTGSGMGGYNAGYRPTHTGTGSMSGSAVVMAMYITSLLLVL